MKRLSNLKSDELIAAIGRAELYDHPIEYFKAVRATLIGLGYSVEWVDGEFRERLEKAYFPEWYQDN